MARIAAASASLTTNIGGACAARYAAGNDTRLSALASTPGFVEFLNTILSGRRMPAGRQHDEVGLQRDDHFLCDAM